MMKTLVKEEKPFELAVCAAMIAGACTFLSVYCTQPLLPYFQQVFHASEFTVSLTVSVVNLAVAMTAPLTGLFAESIGRKKVIVPALFGMALTTLLAATATSLPVLIFWRFMQGICVPGVIAGSFISSRAPDRYIRPAITFVIFASGLKYVGLGTTSLGWVLCAILLGTAVIWLTYARPWRSGAPLSGDPDQPEVERIGVSQIE